MKTASNLILDNDINGGNPDNGTASWLSMLLSINRVKLMFLNTHDLHIDIEFGLSNSELEAELYSPYSQYD